MFIDGVGSDHPRSRKLLAQHVLELLALGPENIDRRLVQVVDEHTVDVVAKKLNEIVADSAKNHSISAWKMLIFLHNEGGEVFKKIIRDNWPAEPLFIIDILDYIDEPLPSDFIVNSVKNAVLHTSPEIGGLACSKYLSRISIYKDFSFFPDHSCLRKINYNDEKRGGEDYIGVFSSKKNSALRFKQKDFYDENFLKDFDKMELFGGWNLLSLAAKFSKNSSIESMVNFLNEINSTEMLNVARSLREYIPWPISMVIDSLTGVADIVPKIIKVKSGDFGDKDAWKIAEARWRKNGVLKEDFLFSKNNDFPTKMIGEIGLPRIVSYQIAHGQDDTVSIIKKLSELIDESGKSAMRKKLLDLVQFSMLGLDPDYRQIDFLWAKEYLKLLCEEGYKISLNMLCLMPNSIWSDYDIVFNIAKNSEKYLIYSGNKFSSPILYIVNAYNEWRNCRGLLVLIVLYFGYSQDRKIEDLSVLDDSAFSIIDSDCNIVKMANILIGLSCGENISPIVAAKNLCQFSQGGDSELSLDLVAAFFEIDDFLVGMKEMYLNALLYEMQSNHREYLPKFRDVLKNQINYRKSTLIKRVTWVDELNLPTDSFDALQEKSDR